MTEPPIIRQDLPHEVIVTEGSQLAASRSLDPGPPQVRRTLPDEASDHGQGSDREADLAPAVVAPSAHLDAPVLQAHATSAASAGPDVPDALARPSVRESIVFERSVLDGENSQAPVISRSLQDHRQALPPQLEQPVSQARSPVIDHASGDRFIQLPGDMPAASPPAGPMAQPHHLQDRFVSAPPREGSSPQTAQPSVVDSKREPPHIDTGPSLPPVPADQAHALIAETAHQAQARVEETLGGADPSWAQMDFPARLIRLRKENDTVRTRLEQLERMDRPGHS